MEDFFYEFDNKLIAYIQYVNETNDSIYLKIMGLFFKALSFIITCFICFNVLISDLFLVLTIIENAPAIPMFLLMISQDEHAVKRKE